MCLWLVAAMLLNLQIVLPNKAPFIKNIALPFVFVAALVLGYINYSTLENKSSVWAASVALLLAAAWITSTVVSGSDKKSRTLGDV